ncbi:MAG: hypothetical protein AAF125_18665, partial [Chloroflexota bacterium]
RRWSHTPLRTGGGRMTHHITLSTAYRVNPVGLDEAFRAALGEAYNGLTTRPGEVRVLLNEAPTAQAEAAARAALDAHDPRDPTIAEVAAASRRSRRQALADADAPLTMADFATQPEVVRALARKVLLLEARQRGDYTRAIG